MVMTSVSGHLLSLDFAPAYKSWYKHRSPGHSASVRVCVFHVWFRKSCSPSSLFTAEVKRFCPENFTPIKVYVILPHQSYVYSIYSTIHTMLHS